MTDLLSNPAYEQPVPKRPTFLTVLCILTFIGSGWGVIGNIIGYLGAEKNAETMGMAKQILNSKSSSDEGSKLVSEMMGTSVFTADNLKYAALAGLAGAIFCLAGAILMWNLKKTGFFSYLLGTAIGLAVPLVLFGFGNIFGLMSVAIGGLFGIGFCIMYGVNLKYMK